MIYLYSVGADDMGITELAVLRWLHIIAMVYWLGGKWGVFSTSTHVCHAPLYAQ
jgi:hypothetical protein